MPTRNSTAIGVRIDNEVITQIKQRISKKGISFNRWVNWSIENGLRSHKGKTNEDK